MHQSKNEHVWSYLCSRFESSCKGKEAGEPCWALCCHQPCWLPQILESYTHWRHCWYVPHSSFWDFVILLFGISWLHNQVELFLCRWCGFWTRNSRCGFWTRNSRCGCGMLNVNHNHTRPLPHRPNYSACLTTLRMVVHAHMAPLESIEAKDPERKLRGDHKQPFKVLFEAKHGVYCHSIRVHSMQWLHQAVGHVKRMSNHNNILCCVCQVSIIQHSCAPTT